MAHVGAVVSRRVRITVRSDPGRGDKPSRGQDIGVYAVIDGKRAILPVTGLVLRVDGRKSIATVNLHVDEVDIANIERVDGIEIVPRFVDKERRPEGPDRSLEWESVNDYEARHKPCGFVAFVGADATIEEHMRTCKGATEHDDNT